MASSQRVDDPQESIDRLRSTGMPDAVIFGRLLLEGWSPQVLAAALPRGTSVDVEKPQKRPRMKRPARMRVSLSMMAVLVIVLGAFGGAFYTFSKPPIVYSISIAETHASTSLPVIYGALPALSDPLYHKDVRATMVTNKASFIDADLTAMRLVVYVEGEQKLEVPILAKGRPGSWWETPAGLYKIQTKEKMHFSTFGEVSMPYSLDFQGNFFIHGWPNHPDGTPVSSTYSGGCIRLSTEDARKVYDLVEVGMPVIVYNELPAPEGFRYQLKPPELSAMSYLVADVKSGMALISKSANNPAPIASITKLVTALVATEYINLDKSIRVPPEAIVYTSKPRLKVGTEVRAYDLLFLLLQESSNEAAETLAAERGREQFVQYMNSKAQAIGLKSTQFNDPSGAESDFSTPEDLFTLLRYIKQNRRFVFGITIGDIKDSAYGKSEFQNIGNFNFIKNSPAELLGGKVGQTNEAGETYAGVFSVDIGNQTREIAVVVLGSKDAESDVRQLLQFIKKSYTTVE